MSEEGKLEEIFEKSSKKKKSKSPETIERGIFRTIRGEVDEDTLLIEPTEDEIVDTFNDIIARVNEIRTDAGVPTDYKIFMFMHLNSKQGPKAKVPGTIIEVNESQAKFLRDYQENLMELENRYIGGEEYNEHQLTFSRKVNVQFHYQVWEKGN